MAAEFRTKTCCRWARTRRRTACLTRAGVSALRGARPPSSSRWPPDVLAELSRAAMRDIAHLFRPAISSSSRDILRRSGGVARTTGSWPSSCSRTRASPPAACSPSCQDTGTAIVMGKKGQQVLTGGGDEAAIARGVFDAYRTRQPALLAARAARHVPTRSTPARTCRRRSRSTPSAATSTSSCSWPRAAARPTRASSSRRPRRSLNPQSLAAVPRGEGPVARHRRVPALPPAPW